MADYNIYSIYDEMEEYLLKSMARNLKRHTKEESAYGFEWEQWQAAKLREMRKFRKHNQKIIGQHTKNLPQHIKQHLENEYKQGLIGEAKKYKEKFDGKTIDLSDGFFGTNDRKVQSLIDTVNNDLQKANHAALRRTNDIYRQTVHKAAMYSANGVMTGEQAINKAIDEFMAAGINCIVYANGARHTISNYAKMAVRTAETRAMLMGEGKFRQEYGETLVQITKHGTACPLCQPFENKVFIDDVYSGGTWENSKDKYEQVPVALRGKVRFLSEAMAEGLYHPNCRHGVGTYYVELLDSYKPKEAEPPKAPEKTAEEIAAEQAAAKAAAEAAHKAAVQDKYKQLYKLNAQGSLTPDDMAKIQSIEDDLMNTGDYDPYEAWAAKKTAETEDAYQTLYDLQKVKDANGVLTVDEQDIVADIMDKLDNDDIYSYTEHMTAYKAWAANMAKLEAEAKAAKIAADVDSLYDALYNGKTGADVDALKQSILDDADALDAYTKKVEPLFDAAKDEYDVKKAYLKMADKALADADAAEKAAKKAAKDAKDAADQAANDAAIGWLPNYDLEYFAKWGRYPDHTDPLYNYSKNEWRRAKYTEGKTGADLADVIDKINDYDVPNYEMKRRAMEKAAQDKAAEHAQKKAEKKAAKAAQKQAQAEADAAKAEFDKARKTMLNYDDMYSQERKDAAYWFTDKNGGAKGADGILRDTAGEVWRNATIAERDYIYEYTQSYHKYNEPLRGIEYGTNKFLGVGNVDLDAVGTNYGGYKRGEIHAQMKHIESIIDKAEMPEDMWVQRGCGLGGMDKFFGIDASDFYLSESELAAKLLDTEPTEYAFMSCGVSKGKGLNTSGGVVLNIYCPKGTKGMYLEPISAFGNGSGRNWDGLSKQSSFGHEAEILLQHGTRMRVTKVTKGGGTWYIDVDVIEQGVNTI